MKVIFLDVDGVLSHRGTFSNFDRNCLALLADIVEQTDAKIVISSSWREDENNLNFLMARLGDFNLHEKVVGKTPILWELSEMVWNDDTGPMDVVGWIGQRGHEIEKFIKSDLIDIEKFVILDDDPLAKQREDWPHGKWIQTFMDEGLNTENARQAIDFLNG